MAEKIKVLLANEPQICCESLKAFIRSRSDMELVGEVSDLIELLLKVGETQAEILVITISEIDKQPGIFSHLFAEYPQLLIIALTPICDGGFLYRQIISKERFSGKSDDDVATAIRKAKMMLGDTVQ